MIPTVLLAGLVVGFLLGRRRVAPVWGVPAVLALGVGWGIVILARTPGAWYALENFDENTGLATLFLFAESALLGMANAAPALVGGWWLGRKILRAPAGQDVGAPPGA